MLMMMMVVKMEMTAMAMTTTQCEYWGKRSWMAPMESKSPVPRIHIMLSVIDTLGML